MENLLTIGQFSQLTCLTPKALRLYDQEGILRPALVDAETGYRYYNMAQTGDAERVHLLRSLNMPLSDIRAVLKAQSPAHLREKLLCHRERLRWGLANQQRMLETLEALLGNESRVAPHTTPHAPYEVKLGHVEAQPYLGIWLTCHPTKVCDAITGGENAILGHLKANLGTQAGPRTVVYHCSDEHDDCWHVEVCQPYRGDLPLEASPPLRVGTLPAGPVAYTVHAGPYGGYNGMNGAYRALLSWIQANGYKVAGPPRETYVFTWRNADDPSDYRTKIAWPVARA